jgi:hypothetical protein
MLFYVKENLSYDEFCFNKYYYSLGSSIINKIGVR